MGRKRRKSGWLWRLLAVLLLLVLAGAGWLWWQVQHWTPDEETYPDQGVTVGVQDGAVNFRTLRALGADFVYLAASDGAQGQDARFVRNFEAAGKAGLQVGAVHVFDPCAIADRQSANFVTMVPRSRELLPPVIALASTADGCEERVSEAAVESELMTLINQVESHVGKPAILKISPDFEARYGIAHRIERNLWLTRTRFEPAYAGRPWLLWSANEHLVTEASNGPLEWVVVRN